LLIQIINFQAEICKYYWRKFGFLWYNIITMVDLLKGHTDSKDVSIVNSSNPDKNASNASHRKLFSATTGTKDRTDLKKYRDPEGLSVEKLNIGLWFIRNRHIFYKVFITLLILISVFTWANFLFTFGSYVFFGMKADNRMLQELTTQAVHPEIIAAQAGAPIQMGTLQVLKNSNGNYDFVIQAQNPNTDHVGIVSYYVAAGDDILAESHEKIFPEELKHFLILDVEYSGNPNQIEFFVKSQNWSRISRHNYPDWRSFYDTHYDFEFNNKSFTVSRQSALSERLDLNDLEFEFHNQSAYNYWQVKLNLILSSRGKIVGVNTYEANEVLSGELRPIKITWPGRLAAVSEIAIEPFVDILDSSSFIDFAGEDPNENLELE